MPYSQLLAAVYERLAQEWTVPVTREQANIFGASIPDWPEFADSPVALPYLKQHYRLVILSNVDRISFRASNLRLRWHSTRCTPRRTSAPTSPNPRNFEYMLRRLHEDFGLQKSDILHTAQSLFHDHAPAKQIGLASAWIDRRHDARGWGATVAPPGTPAYDFRFESLAAFVAAHRQERGG